MSTPGKSPFRFILENSFNQSNFNYLKFVPLFKIYTMTILSFTDADMNEIAVFSFSKIMRKLRRTF